MVNCPRDNCVLVGKKIWRYDGEVCPSCSGVWLCFETVKGLYENTYIHAPSKFYHEKEPNFDYDSWGSKIKCPDDGTPLETYVFRGIKIDICPSCKGLWLDRGEMEKLYVSKGMDILRRLLWLISRPRM